MGVRGRSRYDIKKVVSECLFIINSSRYIVLTMQNTTQKKTPSLINSLKKKQSELVELIAKELLSRAFENRYTLHPRKFQEIAAGEGEAYLRFLTDNGDDAVVQHGRQRALQGLGERPLLALLAIIQNFSLALRDGDSFSTIQELLEKINAYRDAYLYGYMTECVNQTLKDQEQLRRALSTALENQRHELYIKNHAIHTYRNGIILTDLVGRITYANPAFTKIWGLDSDEGLLKTDCSRFLGIKNFDGLLQSVYRYEVWQNEFVAARPDGSTFDVAVSASLIQDEKDHPVGIMAFFTDITENKQMEMQLQRAHKMEAIGTLAGGVAHDLNNILSGIVSYPDIILLDLPDDSPLRGLVWKIKESGQKAASVVNDLLTLARRGVAVKEVVNLNDIVRDYLVSPEYEKLKDFHENVTVETDLEEDLIGISGSPVHLFKTLMNLVTNAAEAMPDGGKITVSTRNYYLDKPIGGYNHIKEGDYALLIVSDTGVGIPKKDTDRIFEPFYTKKVMGRSGSGLGMTVVWGTVKDHGGHIDVQSKVKVGSTFTLYFPVTREQPAKNSIPAPLKDFTAKCESVVIVDDIEEQLEVGSRLLERLGYSVTPISSGEEAVNYMRENSADLLVLDMIMDPGIDGLETYKRILKFHPDQKAIIVSGYTETDRVKKAQELGVGAYVQKPYVLEKLSVAVRNELDK